MSETRIRETVVFDSRLSLTINHLHGDLYDVRLDPRMGNPGHAIRFLDEPLECATYDQAIVAALALLASYRELHAEMAMIDSERAHTVRAFDARLARIRADAEPLRASDA